MNNERLRELEQQSVVYTDDDDDDGWDFDRWKFAELIVRKCMAICEDVTERNEPAIACYYAIKQHFGVKE